MKKTTPYRIPRILFPFLLLFFLLPFSGCLSADAEVYGQKEVLEYVDSVCPEPYELVGKELIEEAPDNMEYEFRTLNRDLTFHANSYLAPVYIDATRTPYYTRELSCDYVNVVHDLYRADLKRTLEMDSHYLTEYGWYYLTCFSDIEGAVTTLLAADRVYQAELSFNPPEFLEQNPLNSLHFVWCASDEEALNHETWVNMTNVGINGLHDGQELYDRLANVYAQLCVDQKIERDDVPEQYLADKHVTLLDTILLNGNEMLYDSEDNPYGPFGLTTDDYRYSWYNADLASYMLVMDIGLITDDMSFPLILREYARALGGSYDVSVRNDTYTSVWTLGADTWVMEAEFDNNVIHWLEIEKNREPLDISWITVEEDSQVSASFCVGVTAEDFCKLFDLEYEVDEGNKTISFRKR